MSHRMTPGDGWERARGLGSLPSTWRRDISHHDGGRGLGIVVFAGKFVYDTRKGAGKTCGTGSDRMAIRIGTEALDGNLAFFTDKTLT